MNKHDSNRHTFRFFGSRINDSRWVLDDAEAHHALKVLRLPSGEPVEVIDGKGSVVTGTLVPTGKESAEVNVTRSRTEPAEPVAMELAMGALKPGDFDDVLPALVELGMTRISLFLNEQTGKSRVADKSLDRWQRIVDASVKQSKRAWRPAVSAFASLDEWLRTLPPPSGAGDVRWIFLEPSLATAARPAGATPPRTNVTFTGLVGSEKGFSPAEARAAIEAGFSPASLGPHVLRARTAAIAAATMLAMAGHAPQ
jgi:16S rRNA (uracil1498-N3)-methyltransferase